MNAGRLVGVAMVLALIGAGTAPAEDRRGSGGQARWWHGQWKEEFWDGPCEVKIESKRGEFKREVKCKDGVGARWRVGKREFRDGPCTVKIEATRDEYKEEVKCERA